MAEENKIRREIVHLDLDAFFVSVEVLKNSQLRGKPLIVGGGDRGVVAACSYEARKYGIHSAMPMRIARRLCPQAIVISGDHENYAKYSRLVTDVIAGRVPLYEKASIDEFYVDLTGMDKHFGCSKFSAELKQLIKKETGLPISYALAQNKLVSKVATNEVKPNGQIVIPFGDERTYLAPLKIERMPGIGEKTATFLRDRRVTTFKILSEVPEKILTAKFGKGGIELSRKSKGIDESPVISFREQKSISTENTFSNDTIDIRFLSAEIVRLTEKIGFELRAQNKLTGCITLKMRFANFDTVTKQKSIPYTAADHELLQVAKELFDKLYDRRLLVRLVGIRFTDLVHGNKQIDAFLDTQEMVHLYQALDGIKRRYGADAIIRACGI
jgi:DNA polymerase-4